MSAWPGKYVIGLTGNIATGKSVVRKMLEHLGAYGIDADGLSHRAIAKGAPGYQPIIDTFGKWILAPDGQIDRAKLARLVFANPDALVSLEDMVHPLVGEAVDVLVSRSKHRVIVLEAIKLLEGDLHKSCDTIWVTHASQSIQFQRLSTKRGMSKQAAWQRIYAQSSQEEKVLAADVVIQNDKSFEITWKQVLTAWKRVVAVPIAAPVKVDAFKPGTLFVQRAGPQQAAEIAAFISSMNQGERVMSRADVMEAFGEKAFMLLVRNKRIVGIVGWQVENLVARVDDVYIHSDLDLAEAMKTMIAEVERASCELQCEAALLFLPPDVVQHGEIWKYLNYQARTIKDLGVRAWQDAARESNRPGTVMLFKQLRKDRVLRPV